MPFAITHPREPARAGELNAWLAPGFSPLHVFRQMRAALRGTGGQIEQSFLYYDHASALDWIDTA